MIKQLRVFVSSTFNDMRAERSLMVGKIFPMVAAYCHLRQIEFVGVDLRWGVSEEQSKRGQTVQICMDEIDRCRPLFIGMIGERYGWIPQGSPVSVTEKEILYGALNAPEGTEAFFYLRDKSLTESLIGSAESDAEELLNDLKARIRAGSYPVMDGYRDLESFGEQVYRDLCGAVDRLVSRTPQLDPTAEERANQCFLAQRHAANVVSRPDPEKQLDEAAARGGLTLITGEPGVGKTSLLSAWALGHYEDKDRYIFLYFLGESSDRDWEQPARQLIAEVKEHFSLDYPTPGTREELRRAVHIVLNMAAKKGKLCLVLDRLDALPLSDSFGLSWLPEELPEGVSILTTADEGEVLDRLRKRLHHELHLEKLTPDEVEHVAGQYLAKYSKTLGLRHLAMLKESENTAYPLYLITLLNEIRHIGRHNILTEQLSEYLACENILQLYEKVLERFDREYDEEGSHLPERMFRLLLASPGGLTESELLSLLEDVPQAYFAPLHIALEPYTAVSNGAIHITISKFRQAVQSYYRFTEAEISESRNTLKDWFTVHTEAPRRNSVLPCLLKESGDHVGLFSLLSDPDCFSELWQRNKYKAKEYWAFLAQNGHSASEGFQDILTEPGSCESRMLLELGEMFTEAGCIHEARTILTVITAEGSSAEESQKCQAYGMLGNISQRAGKLRDAEHWYKRKYVSAKELGDRYEQQRSLGNLGLISLMQGDLSSAQKSFESVMKLANALNHRDAQQIALGNLGSIAFSLGEADKAEELFLRQKAISRDSGNSAGLINAAGALGVLYLKKGLLSEAETEFRLQEAESRKIGAADGLSTSLGNLAAVYHQKGERNRAEKLFEEKRELCHRTGQALGEQNALGNLARLAAERGCLPTALDYAERRTELTRSIRAARQYAEALQQLSEIENMMERETDARQHQLQAAAIAKQHGFSLP